MLAFAQDLSHRSRGLPCKCDLEARNALHAVLLAKLHCEASNLETRHFASELRAKCVCHQSLSNLGALSGDSVGGSVPLRRFKPCDLLEAFDFGENIGFDAAKPLTIRKLGFFGEQRGAGWGISLRSKGVRPRVDVRSLIDQRLTRIRNNGRGKSDGRVCVVSSNLAMTPQGTQGRAPDLHRQGILTQFVASGGYDARKLGQRNSLALKRSQCPLVCGARSLGTLLAVVANKSLETIEPICSNGGQLLLAKHANATGISDREALVGIGFCVGECSCTRP